ncbi:MAG TPA: exosortase family protein XrtF [Flavobacterium sp.]
MESYVSKYRPFLLFLAKFFLTYVILTIIYQIYLSQYDFSNNEVDGITQSVASQAEGLLLFFNADAASAPHESQPCIKLFYNGKYVARIIEGCNAMSVMILFAAFVVAFAGKLKHTVLYILAGFLIIHILNISRIALLCSAMFHYPEYEHFLHGVVFPLFIYSVVFILWVIWVNKFSLYASKPAQK